MGTPPSIPNPSRYPNLHPFLPASLQPSSPALPCGVPMLGELGLILPMLLSSRWDQALFGSLWGALGAPCLGCETFRLPLCWGNSGGPNTEQEVCAREGAVNSGERVTAHHSGGHPFASTCHPPHCPCSLLPVTASLPPSSSPSCPTGLSAGIPQPGCPQPESTANPILVSSASLRPAVPTIPPHCHPSPTPDPLSRCPFQPPHPAPPSPPPVPRYPQPSVIAQPSSQPPSPQRTPMSPSPTLLPPQPEGWGPEGGGDIAEEADKPGRRRGGKNGRDFCCRLRADWKRQSLYLRSED